MRFTKKKIFSFKRSLKKKSTRSKETKVNKSKEPSSAKKTPSGKILTAEGWRRLMIKKTGKKG